MKKIKKGYISTHSILYLKIKMLKYKMSVGHRLVLTDTDKTVLKAKYILEKKKK